MKGIVFTEFLEFVSEVFSEDTVDDIIDMSDLPSGGAYTSVGTYDYTEMQSLVVALSKVSETPAPELLRSFGRHLAGRFATGYSAFFQDKGNLFDFLESVQNHIHVEVRKLYPDAELPSIEVHTRTADEIQLNYRSCRALSALAEGLILGAADYYKETINVGLEPLQDTEGNFVRFSVGRNGNAQAS